MYTIQAKIIGARIGFKLVFLSGFWLSRSGKPSQSGIVTLHKLISLAQVVVLYLVLRQFQQTSSLTTMELIAATIAGGFFLIMILTGWLLSTNQPMPAILLLAYKALPTLTLIASGVLGYLLLTNPAG